MPVIAFISVFPIPMISSNHKWMNIVQKKMIPSSLVGMLRMSRRSARNFGERRINKHGRRGKEMMRWG
jgi:hypothetical protein